MHIHNEDCLNGMKEIPENTIDAIVTDPPYGLKFMGKEWDHGIPGIPFWQEALRVSKPGAHMLAFGGTRTHHRLMVAIEDAGWEIRDCLMWVYGSGFPKSLDVSKAIDKLGGIGNPILQEMATVLKSARESRNLTIPQADALFCESSTAWCWYEGRMYKGRFIIQPPNKERADIISKAWVETSNVFEKMYLVGDKIGEVTHQRGGGEIGDYAKMVGSKGVPITCDVTELVSSSAKQWSGWGTALKPSWEPIILCRKPLEGTVAENVQKWGVGGINIDGCRVVKQDGDRTEYGVNGIVRRTDNNVFGKQSDIIQFDGTHGRFPANIIHDGSNDVLELFPNTKSGVPGIKHTGNSGAAYGKKSRPPGTQMGGYGDVGSASRFFYCAKASKSERGVDNKHPTVKPIALMRYLCRLITPRGGLILDPFAGSGSTGVAATAEGFDSVLIELEAVSANVARSRNIQKTINGGGEKETPSSGGNYEMCASSRIIHREPDMSGVAYDTEFTGF